MTATEVRAHLTAPIDAASVAVFRRVFGVLALIITIRFVAMGSIAEYYTTPTHFFHYLGFSWVTPWPGIGMYLHFGAMAVLALMMIANRAPRFATGAFGALFAYAHLIDKTNYLNHYYLVICVCFVLTLLPAPALRVRSQIPRWVVYVLRTQIGLVYVFGGIAKLKYDWLFAAQPMSIWLSANGITTTWIAFAAAWAGLVFDLSIVPLLLWRRSRPFAYAAVIAFHVITACLLPLGMFPWIMIGCSLIFLPPDWPHRLLGRPALLRSTPVARIHRAVPFVIAGYLVLQLALPLRHFVYPGDVCWTEQGFRFAWHVMVMEKDGSVVLHVREPATDRRWDVRPGEYLTRYQTRMMATQPDMILELAHIVADDFRARGIVDPVVTVDAFVSLDGRRRARLIDPTVDLATISDGLGTQPWILPAPGTP
jgi:vitamin K-dependent gamma-carboxylase